jgi:copper homeostasis protein
MSGTPPILLEVIACSVSDAVEAERGGASRLEVIGEFESGGLTPPAELVSQILSAVKIPARVMLRESEGYAVTGAAEVARLCTAARDLAGLPVDGLVLGFSLGGEVDVELTERILSCAPHLNATFHHAFEESKDPAREIARLKGLRQVDRILTAGGEGDWPLKIERLAGYERAARPEISILAGGGLDAGPIRSIRESTSIREFHVGRAVRLPRNARGAVSSARVAELVSLLGVTPAREGGGAEGIGES